MNIAYIARQIVSADREINTVEESIHSIDANISRKSKEAYGILTKISREKDLKRVITYQKENEEISKLEKQFSQILRNV